MILDWWMAHRFEFLISGVVIIAALIFWWVCALMAVIGRKRK